MTDPSEQLPQAQYVQDSLFDGSIVNEAILRQTMTTEEYAEHSLQVRQRNMQVAQEAGTLVAQAVVETPTAWNKGGAYGGALARRIKKTDSVEKLAATNEEDIAAVSYDVIKVALFARSPAELRYRGTLFTPTEFGAITLSAEALKKRVGNHVLNGTEDRPVADRRSRRIEVLSKTLARQHEKASEVLVELHQDYDALKLVGQKMKTPGRAQIPGAKMDSAMDRSEQVFTKMFEAIVANNFLASTQPEGITVKEQSRAIEARVASLKAAFEYKLAAHDQKGDYASTMKYWKQMCILAKSWTEHKMQKFDHIQKDIHEAQQAV